MSQVTRACGAQYERPGGRERGDRVVRCDLWIGHEGPHEETETGSRWVDGVWPPNTSLTLPSFAVGPESAVQDG